MTRRGRSGLPTHRRIIPPLIDLLHHRTDMRHVGIGTNITEATQWAV